LSGKPLETRAADKDSLRVVFSVRIFAEAFVVKARRNPAPTGREKNDTQRKKDHFWMGTNNRRAS
jgi:hypothetical protein